MVQVDLPGAFAIGQIFAFLSRGYLRREQSLFTNRLLGPFNFYLACGYAPVGMFLLIGWPAWEVMYVTGWVEDPYDRPWVAGFYVAFTLAMILIGNFAFILGHHWYRTGRDRWVVAGAAIGVALTVLPFLLRWGVWWRVGTWEEVRAGLGYSFWETPFFGGWAVIMSYLVVTTVGMGIWLARRGGRLTP